MPIEEYIVLLRGIPTIVLAYIYLLICLPLFPFDSNHIFMVSEADCVFLIFDSYFLFSNFCLLLSSFNVLYPWVGLDFYF